MDDIMDMPSPFAAAQTPAQLPPEFDKLRHMETFSEAMFNRIIDFQEKQHKAWDTSQPFAERITDLPLHALIFSNPDRDPQQLATTIAPFYPLRGEMQQMAHCIKQLEGQARVCDLHPGNGFIGSLLAREGVDVFGLRDAAAKPNQITKFYDADVYHFEEGDLDSVACDVIFSAWMPSGKNLTPAIVSRKPKLIVFIHTEHVDQSTGLWQTGTAEAFIDLPANYKQILEWSIERPQDLLNEIWPELTASIAEIRRVRIYADEPWHDIDTGAALTAKTPYDWELELDMTLTAYQAKMMLREQGFSV
jgi:hypothetical protein